MTYSCENPNNYWDGNGKYQDKFNELSELMPSYGKCDTLAGELIRAANKLAYDFYNNGMCNNTSGAINFLQRKNAVTSAVYNKIYEYSRGLIYRGDYKTDNLHLAIISMIDQTVEFIINNPNTLTTENVEDIHDYSDEDAHYCDECGDELDSGSWGSICGQCEDELEREEYEEEYEEE